MIIFYSFVMMFGGYLLGSYIKQRTWNRAAVVAAAMLIFAGFTQISMHYVLTHPSYQYGGYYRY